jgi:hypothetical protein
MTLNRKPRGRRTGYRPALDALEGRVVLSTAPANVLAIPAQVAQINAEVIAIGKYVASLVPYTLSVQGHLQPQGVQRIAATYATAKADFNQLLADQAAVQTSAYTTLTSLFQQQSALNQTVTDAYNAQVAFISNYYAGLSPSQQVAQASLIQTQLAKVSQGAQGGYAAVHTYYTGQENRVIGLYNQTIGAINGALTHAASAVRSAGTLYILLAARD